MVSVCRLCKGPLSAPLLDFGKTPLANEYLTSAEASKTQERFPLRLATCLTCGHYQLQDQVSPDRMFRHYLYETGHSAANVRHFERFALDIGCVRPKYNILDIGSNDGTLLREFHKLGHNVIGVDAARNLADAATKSGVPTIPVLFCKREAEKILRHRGQFDLITALNVFAHCQDLEDFAEGVKLLLKPSGTFIFEVSYLPDALENGWDTIYHEHTSYHTIAPLMRFFLRLGMCITNVEHISNQGGSIRVSVNHPPAKLATISEPKSFDHLIAKAQENIEKEVLRVNKNLLWHRKMNRKIAIYGVPAKATTYTHMIMSSADWFRSICYAVDDSKLKQWRYMPGLGIPIVSSEVLETSPPEVLLILAWNFAASIMKKYGDRFHYLIPHSKDE